MNKELEEFEKWLKKREKRQYELAKELEDFMKSYFGLKKWRKILEEYVEDDWDIFDYMHWLRILYWSLPVENKELTKKLSTFEL